MKRPLQDNNGVGLRVDVIHTDGQYAIVRLAGELDLDTAVDLRKALTELIDDRRFWLVLDFTGVTFCDSTGLGALVTVFKRVRERGGYLRLAGVRPAVLRVFQLASMDRVFSIYDTLGQAVQP